MKIQSLFTYPHAVQNLNDFLSSAEHRIYFKEWYNCFCLYNYYTSQWDPKQPQWTPLTFTLWTATQDIFQNILFCISHKVIQDWSDMRGSKLYYFNYWMNYHFNSYHLNNMKVFSLMKSIYYISEEKSCKSWVKKKVWVLSSESMISHRTWNIKP